MQKLLLAIASTLQTSLPYLQWVGVVENFDDPPGHLKQFPVVGLRDGGIVSQAQPAQKDDDTLTVQIAVYQQLYDDDPGAALMGRETQLGDRGKGLLDIHEDIRTLLNNNLLAQPGVYRAHRDQLRASEPGETLIRQIAVYSYERLRSA